MATKLKINGLGGMHTAGIYSDMTVDGPEIGTLVVIVDRAKNLPNRKTIGKQDPYCAARLGKEAKKTETDRRGGQTPRWDQELRYTVHDSPDYYQLKVSVFNDDKKTDLIGETWVNLQEVVVAGGGQSDIWHNLSCKGKYAGEIRIEITYYDTRPKQEKPEKTRQSTASGADDVMREVLKGPRQPQQKAPVKRRPLPSDPVSGAPPASPVGTPDHVQTPPRGYPQPLQSYPDNAQNSSNAYQQSPDHVQAYQRGYQPPSAIPEYVQTPPRGHQSASYIPNQSPLQNVEYNTPHHRFPQSKSHNNSPSLNGHGGVLADAATTSSQSLSNERYDMYASSERDGYTQKDGLDHYDDEEDNIDPRDRYTSQHSPYELPEMDDFDTPPSPGGPPPPPPAHRSRHGSSQVSPAPPIASHESYGFPSGSRSPNLYEPQEEHRQSKPAYSQNSYKPYTSPTREEHFQETGHGAHEQSPPRHHSYDSRYDSQDNHAYGSMQPTVEDAPPSPSPAYGAYAGHRGSGSQVPQYDERPYDPAASPAPLNLSGRNSTTSGRNSASSGPTHQYSNSSMGYPSSNSQNPSVRDRSHTETSGSSRTTYSTMQQHLPPHRRQSEDPSMGSSANYGLPAVPATLVAGMDPVIAQEISERIYDEKRASYSQSTGNSPHSRYQNTQYQQNKPHPLSYHEAASTPFDSTASAYDDRQNRFASATTAIVKPRATSPNPKALARKSVSPSPGAGDGRRLSGVPFGPDSYNAFNPGVAGSTPTPSSLSAKYDIKDIDPDAKIITHDGREIDPSDHIPESNYAPLLECKGPKYASQQPDRNYRPPTGSQPMPVSGRRPLRQAGRPHNTAASSPIYMSNSPAEPATPQNRNRLQKKANRPPAHPAPHSSPLAPITPYQDNSPRNLSRSNAEDYHASENYAPQYGSSPGYRGSAGPPPVPAKVPMQLTGPPSHQPEGGDAWALLEEMKNIDLGSGRARRRGY